MRKAFTFRQAPIGAHFVTGPAERLYIKLDENPMDEGGNAVEVGTGDKIWFPNGRIVLKAVKEDFEKAAFIYERDQHTNALAAVHCEAVKQTLAAFNF